MHPGEGEEGAHDEGVGEGQVRDVDAPPCSQLRSGAQGCGRVDGEVVEQLEVGHVEFEVGVVRRHGSLLQFGERRQGLLIAPLTVVDMVTLRRSW